MADIVRGAEATIHGLIGHTPEHAEDQTAEAEERGEERDLEAGAVLPGAGSIGRVAWHKECVGRFSRRRRA